MLDHLWVVPEKFGTGIGRALFQHALQQAEALGAEFLELEADPHAVGFYERMGAPFGSAFDRTLSPVTDSQDFNGIICRMIAVVDLER